MLNQTHSTTKILLSLSQDFKPRYKEKKETWEQENFPVKGFIARQWTLTTIAHPNQWQNNILGPKCKYARLGIYFVQGKKATRGFFNLHSE